MTETKAVKVTLTQSDLENLKDRTGETVNAQAVQKAVIYYLEQHGITATSGDLQHGGWKGNPKSLENLLHYVDKLTNGGRNDPTE
jgi:hypothetical protein